MGFFNNEVPSAAQEMQGVFKQLLKQYPALAQMFSQTTNDQLLPAAQANLEAQKAISAPSNQLSLDMLRQFGPQFAQAGLDIGKTVQQGQAQNNADVANSSAGQAALQANIAADRTANPEFYASRELASKRLGDLMNSIDLSGNLSGGETRAIGQSLAQQNMRSGTVNSPSAAGTVANAMQYGNAAYNRREQAKGDLNQAIGTATSFLPSSKSGVDAWNTATGGAGTSTGTAGSGMGFFGGANNVQGTSNSQGLNGLFNSALGGGLALGGANMNNVANKTTGQENLDAALNTGANVARSSS